MTKALEQSNAKYTAAQKKAVTKSNQFRAHNRDFYGNPVVVTVVAGGAGATAGALSGAAAVAETTGTTPAASNVASGTVTDATKYSIWYRWKRPYKVTGYSKCVFTNRL